MTPEVKAERERCATLVNELATMWENTATHVEKEGTFTSRSLWPPFKKMTFVMKPWKQYADTLRAATEGLRMIHKGIVEGWEKK